MNEIYIKEGRSEVLVVLPKHMPDNLTAIREARKILQREEMRLESNPDRNRNWQPEDQL